MVWFAILLLGKNKVWKRNKLVVFVRVKHTWNLETMECHYDERVSSTLVPKLGYIYAYYAHKNSTQTDLWGFPFLPDFHG